MSVVPDSNEPRALVDFAPVAPAPERAPASFEAQTAVTDIPVRKALAYGVLAAMVAGFLAWGIGEKTYGYYQLPASALGSYDLRALNRETQIVDQKNTAIAFGTFGALLGLFSGAAGGASRRSIPGGASAALGGLLLGGIGGALASYGLAPIFARFYSDETGALLLSFLVRGGIWAVVGMTAGLALGWGWRGPLGITGALCGGLAGGVGGTIAFEVVNAVLMPTERNDAVIPSSTHARLLAYVLVSAGVAIGAVLLRRHPSLPAGPSRQTHA